MKFGFERHPDPEPINDELLSAYLDGEVSEQERRLVEAALATDPSVVRRLASLKRTVQMLQDLPRVPVPRAFTLSEQMIGIAPPKRSTPWWGWVLRGGVVMAVMALMITLSLDYFTNRQSEMQTASRGAPAATAVALAAPQSSQASEAAKSNAAEQPKTAAPQPQTSGGVLPPPATGVVPPLSLDQAQGGGAGMGGGGGSAPAGGAGGKGSGQAPMIEPQPTLLPPTVQAGAMKAAQPTKAPAAAVAPEEAHPTASEPMGIAAASAPTSPLESAVTKTVTLTVSTATTTPTVTPTFTGTVTATMTARAMTATAGAEKSENSSQGQSVVVVSGKEGKAAGSVDRSAKALMAPVAVAHQPAAAVAPVQTPQAQATPEPVVVAQKEAAAPNAPTATALPKLTAVPPTEAPATGSEMSKPQAATGEQVSTESEASKKVLRLESPTPAAVAQAAPAAAADSDVNSIARTDSAAQAALELPPVTLVKPEQVAEMQTAVEAPQPQSLVARPSLRLAEIALFGAVVLLFAASRLLLSGR